MPTNRSDVESDIRNNYEWIIFGGEYHIWQIGAMALDAFASGGALAQQFAINEANKFGVNLANELATRNPKSPIAGGIMVFKIWETPFPGVKFDLGNKYVPYVGVLKVSQQQPSTRLSPNVRGYTEFRRRLEEAINNGAGLPPLTSSTESSWLRYIFNHCVGNNNTRDGYKEFRRRIDLAYQYRYDIVAFNSNYGGKPNLDLDTVPAALPSTNVGNLLKSFIGHVSGNPDGEAGYKEVHRRVCEEILPSAINVLNGQTNAEANWTLYLFSHLAGNFPVIES